MDNDSKQCRAGNPNVQLSPAGTVPRIRRAYLCPIRITMQAVGSMARRRFENYGALACKNAVFLQYLHIPLQSKIRIQLRGCISPCCHERQCRQRYFAQSMDRILPRKPASSSPFCCPWRTCRITGDNCRLAASQFSSRVARRIRLDPRF